MSRPNFMVIKLSDLKIPFIMLVVAIAAVSIFLLSGDSESAETFAPDSTYQDGMYIANIAFADAEMDVVVSVSEKEITSIALDGFDDAERTVYQGLQDSIMFVNDYVTSTQSLEIPESTSISASTSILMDAVKVALSEDENAMVTSTYQAPVLEQIQTELPLIPSEDVVSTENLETDATTDEVTDPAELTDDELSEEPMVPAKIED